MNADASGDRLRIELTGAQNALIAAIHATGKPIVLVVTSGSAVSIPWAADHIPAIVQQFYSGQVGGTALADVIFGDYNPAGRMPLTIYRGLDDLPPFEDYSMANRTYRYFEGTPLYPFGFGLSYTTFTYSDLTLSATPLAADEDLTITVTVTNAGARPGDEVVQAYLSRDDAPVRVPIRQLVAIDRITLDPGESKQVSLIVPARWFKVIDEDGNARFIPGMARISVGGSQPDARSIALGATPPASADVTMK